MAEENSSYDYVRSYLKVTHENYFTARRRLPCHRHHFFINLHISGNSVSRYWATNQEDSTDQPRLFDTATQPLSEAEVSVQVTDLQEELSCHEKARELISTQLECWPLSDEEHQDLLDTVLCWTQETLTSMSVGDTNAIGIDFCVDVIHEHFFDVSMDWIVRHQMNADENENRIVPMDWILTQEQDSMDAAPEIRMVPADESSIENLIMEGKKILTGRDGCAADGDCAVCMDEFLRDCEVICMPCSHYFHGECIKNWLRTSHYCPICRYEMPTSELDI